MYYIGIDGGGTKTAFGLFDEQGTLVERVDLPTCHFLQVGYDGCAKCLSQGVYYFIDKYQICCSHLLIGIGIAGYGNDSYVRKQLEEHISNALKGINYILTNDIHIALMGAFNGEDGIVVVVGTGAIAMAQKNNQIIRCGGWGYQLGDEGSAYWIGKQVLFHFCKQADKREDKDELYERVMKLYHLKNPYELISIVGSFQNERTQIAQLAKVCDELSHSNTSCQKILQEAGKEIATLVECLNHEFEVNPKVSCFGGVFQSHIVKQSFCQQLEHYCICEPLHDALFGAYLLAKNRYK